MFTGAKYIVFEIDTGRFHPALFPRAIEHSKFAGMMPDHYKPVSAGFVTMGLECFGESMSLGLESIEGDTKLIRDMFKSDTQLSIERTDLYGDDDHIQQEDEETYEQDD